MGDWMALLLGPFLVIGAVAVIAGIVTLMVRARGQWSTRSREQVVPAEESERDDPRADPSGRRL
ncbi:hypothetical protein Acsp06_34200 [Actinomycetospora sp. NBRC 106375]|uniref:hypothetical protein n=1 Tax=Actinomycetospora sp. NBRC 106375 TaxID=3032207 RepID=UPI0024A4E23F|nr:hypothetical protein [Actinomycetospora sp. NBRC 106375]GLZ47235.1 hypothetical protein Acsp06_34200 [Actinomycetospora sp. NBRC 106375]